jgi:acetyl-CoA carboxylase alpha subunit
MDIDKRTQQLAARLTYIRDIFGLRENASVALLKHRLEEFLGAAPGYGMRELQLQVGRLEELFSLLEGKLEGELSPMDRVRIVRHPQRISLKDILENVYDNYTEIGGQDEWSIDPGMLIARATIARRMGKKTVHQPVMVIGQEKGHGQEFRNGGSIKPWGNANALYYMRVAEVENIPIHTYVFTPGAFPVEDYPGAAQQIAKNLYVMAGLKVPVVAVFSEGGSGGAEAIALADRRLMLSHGYYSVISPEGAAAIEGGLKDKASPELIERCAERLKITAEDNLRQGLIDRVIQEPPLGARPDNYEFFRKLRREVVRATDEVVHAAQGLGPLRALAMRRDRGPAGHLRALEPGRVRPQRAGGAPLRQVPRHEPERPARQPHLRHAPGHRACARPVAGAQPAAARLSGQVQAPPQRSGGAVGSRGARPGPGPGRPLRLALPRGGQPLRRSAGGVVAPHQPFLPGGGRLPSGGHLGLREPQKPRGPHLDLPEHGQPRLPGPLGAGSLRRIRRGVLALRAPLSHGIPVVPVQCVRLRPGLRVQLRA